ncbi:PaaI family thioesterase [Mycolicibacterium brumae]|uniref:Acyl-coenzyme A thioesterase THEM4 n=1 Tax=Mycolicibacterium brumae TaxID=85968 RepID=A0A2G5PGI2_9MYCO|nr:PaaI family thioesterase [Mycolicibacterium brumae]MCV7192597.1 PaaI family thioesterase [Mycolicibacterium brumae]PIB77416.1 PaaI family thioesterase [Mycolicibacterium brumae]RWA18411.1 hypothetical protein MBRU_04135 [Mycolicibacterium brumae DSM 44177]UWW10367.1 PaaI family thioesterase [Mycolicibacterium brumae]
MAEEADPTSVDPDYERHGGFPRFSPADPGPGFGEFVAGMRRLQDLAVSADPDDATWDVAAAKVAELVELLAPSQAGELVGPAGRSLKLPAAGSLLLPPWQITAFGPDGVALDVTFSRYHVGGNNAVHGGVLPLLFDTLFGMTIRAVRRPISRTAFLHVDYRKVTPIDVQLSARGWVREIDGRKTFVNAELRDPDGALLAEANGLMVRLLPHQP